MIICKNDNQTIRGIDKNDLQNLLEWVTNPAVLKYYEGRDSGFALQAIKQKLKDFGLKLNDNMLIWYKGAIKI